MKLRLPRPYVCSLFSLLAYTEHTLSLATTVLPNCPEKGLILDLLGKIIKMGIVVKFSNTVLWIFFPVLNLTLEQPQPQLAYPRWVLLTATSGRS